MSEGSEKKIHQGRNVKPFREMPGLKQEKISRSFFESSEAGMSRPMMVILNNNEEFATLSLAQAGKGLAVVGLALLVAFFGNRKPGFNK